jgi:hypothetical protein
MQCYCMMVLTQIRHGSQHPPSVTSALTVVMTSFAVKLSRPLVGSSRNSTRGDVMSKMPMLTRLAWPPLIPFSRRLPILTFLQAQLAPSAMPPAFQRSKSQYIVQRMQPHA